MNNGGQAFPGVEHYCDRDGDHVERWAESWGGMTLRDYFAAKAMHAMLNNDIRREQMATMSSVAKDAYRMADAMLAASVIEIKA